MGEIKINKIIRSRRKTIGIIVERDASVTVRAPKRVPLKFIKSFVNEKSGWIKKYQHIAKEKFKENQPKQFVEGEEFYFIGKKYPLLYVKNPEEPLVLDMFNFVMDRRLKKYAREVFISWYKIHAYHIITQKVDYFSRITGLNYNRVKINNAQKRWGSCSSRGNLNFSWRVIMAPEDVIDYLIIHELAHTKELNHSPRFWDIVAYIMPDYEDQEKWLRDNGHLLLL